MSNTLVPEKIKLGQIEPIKFSDLIEIPTTLEGYGIIDAYTIEESLERFVRYDEEQELTESQQEQARLNIGIDLSAIGGSGFNLTLGTPNGLVLVGQELSLNLASVESPGAMSVADKIKLDNIPALANNYVHPTQPPIDTNSLTGKVVLSRIAANTLGHLVGVETRILPFVDIASDETITGLKTIRRAGTNDGVTPESVLRFDIGTDGLYELRLMNSQNVISPGGEVNWYWSMSENYNSGTRREFSRIGFHRGGITIIGAQLPSNVLSSEIATFVNSETTNTPYFISTYIARALMVQGRGYFGKDDLTNTQFLTSSDTLYSSGNIYSATGIRTSNPVGNVLNGTTWRLGSAFASSGHNANRHIDIEIDGVMYELLAKLKT